MYIENMFSHAAETQRKWKELQKIFDEKNLCIYHIHANKYSRRLPKYERIETINISHFPVEFLSGNNKNRFTYSISNAIN